MNILPSLVGTLCAVAAAQVPIELTTQVVPDDDAFIGGPIVAVRAPHDGSGRLFAVLQNGQVRVIKNGALLPEPFLTAPVNTGGGERGLLGLAFHPNFGKPGLPHNDELYIAYAPFFAREFVVERRTVAPESPDVATPDATTVLRLEFSGGNHLGGDLHFGPDNYLYVSTGDGGTGTAQQIAQCLWKTSTVPGPPCLQAEPNEPSIVLLGKILRIDVDTRGGTATPEMCGTTPGAPAQYAIPPTNPHVGTQRTCDEIWAHGLRNPWRFSFDRLDGRLIVGDVGQGVHEEIDAEPAASAGGYNYGWPLCEGPAYYPPASFPWDCPATTGTRAPVLTYMHDRGDYAVTGGYVYRGPIAELQGLYFYGDSVSGRVWVAATDGPAWDADGQHLALPWTAGGPMAPVFGFGEDEAGDLYYTGYKIYKIVRGAPIFVNGFE